MDSCFVRNGITDSGTNLVKRRLENKTRTKFAFITFNSINATFVHQIVEVVSS